MSTTDPVTSSTRSMVTFTLKSPSHALEGTGLHDATLQTLTLNWKEAELAIHFLLVGGMPVTLTFHGLTSAGLPRNQPWGPSSQVLGANTLGEGDYEIEMQSGDKLRLLATGWSMNIYASPSESQPAVVASLPISAGPLPEWRLSMRD